MGVVEWRAKWLPGGGAPFTSWSILDIAPNVKDDSCVVVLWWNSRGREDVATQVIAWADVDSAGGVCYGSDFIRSM